MSRICNGTNHMRTSTLNVNLILPAQMYSLNEISHSESMFLDKTIPKQNVRNGSKVPLDKNSHLVISKRILVHKMAGIF